MEQEIGNLTVNEVLESLNEELEMISLDIDETEKQRNSLTEELNSKRKKRTRVKNRIKNLKENILEVNEDEENELEETFN